MDTTSNLICETVKLLDEHPEQARGSWRENPALIPQAVEEGTPPTPEPRSARCASRRARSRSAASRFPPASLVWGSLASANHDETVFRGGRGASISTVPTPKDHPSDSPRPPTFLRPARRWPGWRCASPSKRCSRRIPSLRVPVQELRYARATLGVVVNLLGMRVEWGRLMSGREGSGCAILENRREWNGSPSSAIAWAKVSS